MRFVVVLLLGVGCAQPTLVGTRLELERTAQGPKCALYAWPARQLVEIVGANKIMVDGVAATDVLIVDEVDSKDPNVTFTIQELLKNELPQMGPVVFQLRVGTDGATGTAVANYLFSYTNSYCVQSYAVTGTAL
jgi:hypothetical protein